VVAVDLAAVAVVGHPAAVVGAAAAAVGVETGIAAAGVVGGRKVAIATNPWRCLFMLRFHGQSLNESQTGVFTPVFCFRSTLGVDTWSEAHISWRQ
jgi:hypothetical protein